MFRKAFIYLFVCMYVCLLAISCQNYWMDLHEILTTDRPQASDQPIKFWRRSGSRSGFWISFSHFLVPFNIASKLIDKTSSKLNLEVSFPLRKAPSDISDSDLDAFWINIEILDHLLTFELYTDYVKTT